jgi:ribosome-binding protein aMBF1 (putative translation factor)
MDAQKKQKLKKAGWTVGTVDEFLELTPEERSLVELRLRLSDALRARRKMLGWSQEKLADKLGSSQSRIAKMEAGTDRTSSVDLLFRALFVTGVNARKLAGLFSAIQGLGQPGK